VCGHIGHLANARGYAHHPTAERKSGLAGPAGSRCTCHDSTTQVKRLQISTRRRGERRVTTRSQELPRRHCKIGAVLHTSSDEHGSTIKSHDQRACTPCQILDSATSPNQVSCNQRCSRVRAGAGMHFDAPITTVHAFSCPLLSPWTVFAVTQAASLDKQNTKDSTVPFSCTPNVSSKQHLRKLATQLRSRANHIVRLTTLGTPDHVHRQLVRPSRLETVGRMCHGETQWVSRVRNPFDNLLRFPACTNISEAIECDVAALGCCRAYPFSAPVQHRPPELP
jgi:hypothetical protein